MSSRIKAIKALQASIELRRTADMQDIVAFMERHTGLNEGEVWLQLMELRDVLVFYARRGQATKVPGLGTFTPSLRSDGDIHLTFRPGVDLKRALNSGEFFGRIKNKRNRGMSADELVTLWNELHPDDPVMP